ncbi:MAG TPA: HEAT repeat domain-containing protein [Bdellovibrionota bacterium]|nr:HEAT repeat domain-containing protein [Bdellovibrionota bacterium]
MNLFLVAAASLVALAAHADLSPIELAEDLRLAEDPALVDAALSPKPELRARAAQAWGRIQKAAGLAPLYVLADDSEPAVRRAAIFALGQFGWKAEFSAGRENDLIAHLFREDDPDREVRLLAIEALGKFPTTGPRLVLGMYLSNPEAELRAAALLALYRGHLVSRLRTGSELEPLLQWIVDEMAKLATDPDATVRRNLAYYFARIKDPRGSDLVSFLASDPDLWVRYFAVAALQKLADPRGEAAALAATADREYLVRMVAVNALAAMGKASLIPSTVYDDASLHVRAAVATAVGGDATLSVELLSPMLRDASPTVQAAAYGSLKRKLGDASIDLLVDGLLSRHWPVRAATLALYGELAPTHPRALPMLVTGAYDPDPRVVSAATSALAGVEGDQAWYLIRRALLSDAPSVLGAAVDALSSRKEADRAPVAWEAYLRLTGSRWADQRASLVTLLGTIPGDRTTGWLKEALVDPAHAVVLAAAKALKERGIETVVPEATPTVSPYRGQSFTRNPVVVLETSKGEVRIECYPEAAPIHVANFVGLAKAGKYDGTAFHRVVSGFVVQGGSFDGSGYDSGDYAVRAEINRVPFLRGALGMPRGDDFDSGSVQIFLNHLPTPHLDGQYTVFGQATAGLEVIDALEIGDEIVRARVIE